MMLKAWHDPAWRGMASRGATRSGAAGFRVKEGRASNRRALSLFGLALVIAVAVVAFPGLAAPILTSAIAITAGQATVALLERGRRTAPPPAYVPTWHVVSRAGNLVASGAGMLDAIDAAAPQGSLEHRAAVAAVGRAIWPGESLIDERDLIRAFDRWADLPAKLRKIDEAIAAEKPAPLALEAA